MPADFDEARLVAHPQVAVRPVEHGAEFVEGEFTFDDDMVALVAKALPSQRKYCRRQKGAGLSFPLVTCTIKRSWRPLGPADVGKTLTIVPSTTSSAPLSRCAISWRAAALLAGGGASEQAPNVRRRSAM